MFLGYHSSSQACSDSETRLYALALSPDPSPGNKLDPSESPIRVQRVPLPEEVRPIFPSYHPSRSPSALALSLSLSLRLRPRPRLTLTLTLRLALPLTPTPNPTTSPTPNPEP